MSRTLRIAMIVLSVIGIALAGYLTYVHYAHVKVLCTSSHNGGESECGAVQKSVYSELVGVPVALLGLLGYIAILGTLLMRQTENTRMATLLIALGGFGFSAYLTAREVFTLEKICEWCVTSAIMMTILMVLAVVRFLRGDEPTATAAAGPPGDSAGALAS